MAPLLRALSAIAKDLISMVSCLWPQIQRFPHLLAFRMPICTELTYTLHKKKRIIKKNLKVVLICWNCVIWFGRKIIKYPVDLQYYFFPLLILRLVRTCSPPQKSLCNNVVSQWYSIYIAYTRTGLSPLLCSNFFY